MTVSTIDLLRLLCARDAAVVPNVDAYGAPEWVVVQQAVTAWDAAPMVYTSLRETGLLAKAPRELAEAMKRDHAASTAANLRLSFEADELVSGLEKTGVKAVLLKGTALFSLGVWRDPGARPTCDIDLLISKNDASNVDRFLRTQGFEQARSGGVKHLPPYGRNGVVVEVHTHAFWSLSDGHRVVLDEMVDGSGRPYLGGVVAHLVHHLFESSVTTPWLVAKTLADLAEVYSLALAGGGETANEIAAKVRFFGLTARFEALVGLLERVTRKSLFDVWKRSPNPREVDWLCERAAARSSTRTEALRVLDRSAALWRMPLREKQATLAHYFLPNTEEMRSLYGLPANSPWVWPLYAVRPIHLVGQSALDAARLIWPFRVPTGRASDRGLDRGVIRDRRPR
ncbi:MAG: nucleotidyltransferase family protein [Polyangiaceae bacterium]|nr:nucleotidyltransferase family protein [Polyangiaceae bacterium]